MTKLRIEKNGAPVRPWRVTCPTCPPRSHRSHFTDAGVVVVNDGGVGNRTFELAVLAADEHLRSHGGGSE